MGEKKKGQKNVLHYDFGGGYMTIYISSNCTFQIGWFHIK